MMTNLSESVLEYVVFCIENVAERLDITGNEIYQRLTYDSNILDSYIIPSYDSLHTQSKEYIVDDIIDYMRERDIFR